MMRLSTHNLQVAMKITAVKRRNVLLSDDDWADLETIRAKEGLRSQSAAIRKLIEQWKSRRKK